MGTKPRKAMSKKASEDDTKERKVALTLRLQESDWLRLKALAAEMTQLRRRSISAHELVHSATLTMLDEGADGFEDEDGDE